MKVRRIDFYPDDWIAGTIMLSHEERSIYISVCAAIWSRGGPVDEKYVRKICPSAHFKRGLDGLIAKGKVTAVATENGLRLTQKRAENELVRATKRTEIALANGSKGGRPNGLAKPDGFQNQKPINHLQHTTTKKEEDSPPLDSPSHDPTSVSPDGDEAAPRPNTKPKPPLVPLDQWGPSPAHEQQAMLAGRDHAWLFDQADRYRDQQVNAKLKHRDREAGFRNWIRNAPNFERKPNVRSANGHHKLSPVEKLFLGAQRAAEAFGERERARQQASPPLLDR